MEVFNRFGLVLIALVTLLSCDEQTSESNEACIVCRSDVTPSDVPFVDCADDTIEDFETYCTPTEDVPLLCESISICCARAPLGSEGCAVSAPNTPDVAVINNQSLSAVPGEIIFSATLASETHIFSIDRVNNEIYQVTQTTGNYRAVSIGIDRRYLLFSRIESGGNSVVWLFDMQSKMERMISPSECNAGLDGLGWFNDSFVGFAMKCPEDEFSQAYLANIYEENNRATLRQLTDHPADVLEVYPILNSTFFVYARVDPPCNDAGCMATSNIWMGDNEITSQQCRVSSFEAGDDNPQRAITSTQKRLGDFRPSIAADLGSVIFSRTVGAKPQGPLGHHDIWVANTDIRALLGGGEVCGGTMTQSLTETIESDRFISNELNLLILHEYSPTIPFPNADSAISHIFVGAAYGETNDSGVYESAVDGTLMRRTPEGMQVIDATWVQDELTLTGSR